MPTFEPGAVGVPSGLLGVLDVWSMFARSCKRGITDRVPNTHSQNTRSKIV